MYNIKEHNLYFECFIIYLKWRNLLLLENTIIN